MKVFNPDRFFKRRTIFSSENFGPGDQNFQDQNSRDSALVIRVLKIKNSCVKTGLKIVCVQWLEEDRVSTIPCS